MRQFGCIEISRNDALLMRDAMRPLSKVDPYDTAALITFCQKLYAGLLKMRANRIDAINIPLEEHEAIFINHFISNEDWDRALDILEQSWLVIYELQHQSVYPRAEDQQAPAVLETVPQPRDR
jgi:hypothetical protein